MATVITCPACNGTGLTAGIPCPACLGAGKLARIEPPEPTATGTTWYNDPKFRTLVLAIIVSVWGYFTRDKAVEAETQSKETAAKIVELHKDVKETRADVQRGSLPQKERAGN